jgi:uncharacterized protein YutE (UPF0331/DUF86 family)
MLDKNVIVTRIEQIDKHLEKILSYNKLSYEDFLKDTNAQDIVEYNLFQIVNHLINIVQHTVVDEDYGLPQSAYEASQILSQKGILDEDDLEIMKKMIGFRNIVGHDYISIDKEIVYFILTEGIEDIRSILSKITEKFL